MAQASEVAVLQNFAAERRHMQNRFQSLPSYCLQKVREPLFCMEFLTSNDLVISALQEATKKNGRTSFHFLDMAINSQEFHITSLV